MKLLFLLSSLLLSAAQAQPFTKIEDTCVYENSPSPNCPRKYKFSGGPGFVGHRAADWPVKMICTPSCIDNSNPKDCSLILALHGIYSNPNDQEWLMIGSGGDDAYNEDESVGGPYCISFHKAKDDAWEYKCGGDDEAHLEGFINYALDNFPIDPDAVNLHGFSSGAIQTNHMMNTRCSIEKLISAAAPYAAGRVQSPPTTKAAYLITHGTHDEIVPYQDKWNPVTNTNVPSCECTKIAENGCTNNNYVLLEGEQLAGGVATWRGYTGDIWNETPSPSYQLDLINEDVNKCNRVLSECISIVESPNPWNAGLSCDNIPTMETDVIQYPISSDSDAGPVTLWRINQHNHDYPDKRRSPWGATEYFMQLRKFFYDNRGRRVYPGTRSIEQLSTGVLCNNPSSTEFSRPDLFYRPIIYEDWTKEECRDACLNEKRCVEAFFTDLRAYNALRGCVMFTDVQPCSSYDYGAYWSNAVQWKVTTVDGPPTKSPTTYPTRAPVPVTDPPTKVPTSSPTNYPDTFCSSSQTLLSDFQVSYTCYYYGFPVGDFLDGSTTGESCTSVGGDWVPYTCQAALDYWITVTDTNLKDMFKNDWFQPRCCVHDGPTAAPTEETLCYPGETFYPSRDISYSCLVNGASIGDFLDGSTTSTSCASSGGEWVSYNCQTALDYWKTVTDQGMKDFFKDDWWQSRCCLGIGETFNPTAAPTTSPTSSPTSYPTISPTVSPTISPTVSPTISPTVSPTISPTTIPTKSPTASVTSSPTASPTISPTVSPTVSPTASTPTITGFDGVLRPGDELSSPNGNIRLTFQIDGDLVLYDEASNRLWASNTVGISPFLTNMQPDGNLVIYDTDIKPRFATHTSGNRGALLFVQDDGNMVIKDASGTVIWDRINGKIHIGFKGRLRPDDQVFSPNRKIRLVFQQDGNLVLYDENSNPLWASNTVGISPRAANMQNDGNLVIYDTDIKPRFATHTSGNPGAKLFVQDDGNMVILNTSGTPIWDRINGRLY